MRGVAVTDGAMMRHGETYSLQYRVLEWFFSALIPQRLAIQFCRFGEFFLYVLVEG